MLFRSGSYETAWAWLHKLRRAMVRPERDRLSGSVEVDETYLGEEEPGIRGRRTINRAIVVIAVEMNEGNIGRIRLRHVPNVNATSLQGFIVDVVKPGSFIHTDGWQGYANIATKGFRHRVASLLKRWCLGTHQGAISKEHLPYDLDEFTFRFNRRTAKARGLLFYRLVTQAVRTPHVDTDTLFRARGRGRRFRGEANHERWESEEGSEYPVRSYHLRRRPRAGRLGAIARCHGQWVSDGAARFSRDHR